MTDKPKTPTLIEMQATANSQAADREVRAQIMDRELLEPLAADVLALLSRICAVQSEACSSTGGQVAVQLTPLLPALRQARSSLEFADEVLAREAPNN